MIDASTQTNEDMKHMVKLEHSVAALQFVVKNGWSQNPVLPDGEDGLPFVFTQCSMQELIYTEHFFHFDMVRDIPKNRWETINAEWSLRQDNTPHWCRGDIDDARHMLKDCCFIILGFPVLVLRQRGSGRVEKFVIYVSVGTHRQVYHITASDLQDAYWNEHSTTMRKNGYQPVEVVYQDHGDDYLDSDMSKPESNESSNSE